MGRHPSERTPANAGKGKVTPTQIAFIVDRYLAESGYTSTLASFRSECQLHSSATRTKDLPKGLLSLAEILDDYVTLKGQRIVLDQEKQRVETLIRGMQDVVQTYHSSGTDDLSSLAFPSTPLPLQPSEASAFPLASARPSPGNLPPHSVALSTPASHPASANKSKNSKIITLAPSASKKYLPHVNSVAASSKGESSNSGPSPSSASPGRQCNAPSSQSSSVAKILFPQEREESQRVGVNASRESAPSTLSVDSAPPAKKSTRENLEDRVKVTERVDFDGSEDAHVGDDIFDLDIPDLELDFSDILHNLDFDCDDPAKDSVDSAPRPEAGTGQRPWGAADQEAPVDLKSANSHVPEGTEDGGAVTATRGITKRIRLSYP